MTASSVYSRYSKAERARLNKKNEGSYYGAWVPRRSTLGEWIQIDLGKNVKVTRIATQGRHNANCWTKSYSLSYKIQSGSTFEPYNNSQVCFMLRELEMVEILYNADIMQNQCLNRSPRHCLLYSVSVAIQMYSFHAQCHILLSM